MEPHALKTPVLGPGEPRRPLSPSQRTRMRARRSRPSRAQLTTRRRPAALKTPVLGPGEPRRPLSPSQRTRIRAPGRRSRPAAPGRAGPRCLPRPSYRRPGGACHRAGRAAPTAVDVSPHVVAGPPLRAGLGPLSTPAVVPPPWRRLSSGRASRADRCRLLAARCCGPAAPGRAGSRCLLRPSSRRPGGACPRAGRAAPTAVAVSPHVAAGPLLRLGRAPLSTPAVVPLPWRRLPSGRASRADRCRRLAARCCGPAAPG
jgi:hypothetical protein